MSKRQEETLGFVLHDVARMLRWEFDRRAQGLGLTRAQWSVLVHLLREDGMRQNELARLLDIAPITLTGLLDRLERDGWVRRAEDPRDRRAKRVYLTDQVGSAAEQLRGIGRELREEALKGFSEEERHTLMALLLRLRANLGGQRGSPEPESD